MAQASMRGPDGGEGGDRDRDRDKERGSVRTSRQEVEAASSDAKEVTTHSQSPFTSLFLSRLSFSKYNFVFH